jgi:hypothetical protein
MSKARSNCPWVGELDLVEHNRLVRCQRPLPVVTEHPGAEGVLAQGVERTHLEKGAVYDLEAVGPALYRLVGGRAVLASGRAEPARSPARPSC